MKVHGHHPVGARGGEQVGHKAGGDGLAPAVLLVLAGVSVERGNDRDALGRRPLKGINHDQLLHDRLVQRLGMGLDDERVTAANTLLESHEDLAIGEVVDLRRRHLAAQFSRDLLSKFRMGASREKHQLLL